MQIVVLGNGFDLASGLPTSYNDFFDWRFKELKMLSIDEKMSYLYERLNPPFRIIEYMGGEPSDHLLSATSTLNKKEMTFRDIYEEIKLFISEWKENKVNFFDIYFVINRLGNVNWYDVENEILKVVLQANTYDSSNSENIIRKMMPEQNGYKNNQHVEIEKIDKLVLVMFIEICKKDNMFFDIYEVLMQELKKLEDDFREYILDISKKIMSTAVYRDIYTNNCKEVAEYKAGTYVINFNYTSISDFINEQQYMPHEINVHGKYDHKTIFGIDINQCNLESDEHIFAKTYRKIAEKTKTMMLPRKKPPRTEETNLIFYGHSLSKADYSYFQSLFDLYDIYEQSNIIFKYSIYDEEKRYEIEKAIFNKVTTLLIDYGKTMDNKDHGKNLLHKILLEGRLNLEEIELQKMKFE